MDHHSMLDRVLNLPLQLLVVIVSSSWLKIDQQAVLIVESQESLLLRGVNLQLALESHWVTTGGQIG